jgi:methionyl-tRNA formyltransferase
MGADLLVETLPRWMSGDVEPRPQPSEGVTIASKLSKEHGRIDWRQSAAYIERMMRAYDPWPGMFTTYRGKMLKILRASGLAGWRGPDLPGTVLLLSSQEIAVATGEGALLLQEIQAAGGKKDGG